MKPGNTMRHGVQSMLIGEKSMQMPNGPGRVACFVVGEGSRLEMRDCFIQSKKDPSVLEREKEALIEAKLRGDINEPENKDVEDFCFIVNNRSSLDSSTPTSLLLSSTTILDFHFGILASPGSHLDLDKASLLNHRGGGFKAVNPKVLRADNCVFQNVLCGDAISVTLVEGPGYEMRPGAQKVKCKVSIKACRFLNLQAKAIRIEQIPEA